MAAPDLFSDTSDGLQSVALCVDHQVAYGRNGCQISCAGFLTLFALKSTPTPANSRVPAAAFWF